jgi:hypothetical protein
MWQAIFSKSSLETWSVAQESSSVLWQMQDQPSQNTVYIHIQYKIQHMTMPCHNFTSHTVNQTLHAMIKQHPVFKMMNYET